MSETSTRPAFRLLTFDPTKRRATGVLIDKLKRLMLEAPRDAEAIGHLMDGALARLDAEKGERP